MKKNSPTGTFFIKYRYTCPTMPDISEIEANQPELID
jgi:hypothetical protein